VKWAGEGEEFGGGRWVERLVDGLGQGDEFGREMHCGTEVGLWREICWGGAWVWGGRNVGERWTGVEDRVGEAEGLGGEMG